MGIINAIGNAVGLDDVFSEIGKTVRQVLPNKAAQRDFDLKLRELQDKTEARVHEQMLGQLEINKAEAAHSSIFVAGWRPFIGWVCGIALAYHFVLSRFLAIWIDSVPVLGISSLLALVVTMLGSSGLRTYERNAGIERNSLDKPVRLYSSISPVSIEAQESPVPTNEEGDAPWNK